jgi:hypothetical protein
LPRGLFVVVERGSGFLGIRWTVRRFNSALSDSLGRVARILCVRGAEGRIQIAQADSAVVTQLDDASFQHGISVGLSDIDAYVAVTSASHSEPVGVVGFKAGRFLSLVFSFC